MKARTRRKLEMGARALAFCRAYPEPCGGYAIALARLESDMARAMELIQQQRGGLSQVHASAARKRDLCRLLRRAHLAHLRRVARIAAQGLPELRFSFVLQRGTIPYSAFQSAAHRMAIQAERWKGAMVEHGLSETLLRSLNQLLKEFDEVVERGNEGRRVHVRATAGLDVLGHDVVMMVKVLDGVNQVRFADQPGLLAGWASASNVVAVPATEDEIVGS